MTLNVAVTSPRLLVVATDRRLTNLDTRAVMTERSTKLTALWCRDALALIAYNGIGLWHGQTPADWLLDLASTASLGSLPFKEVLTTIRDEAARRIATVPARYDRRHSFVLGAWGKGKTWLVLISNYEELGSQHVEAAARPAFEIAALAQAPGQDVRVLVTGDTSNARREHFEKITTVAKKAGAAGKDIKNLCVSAIQDAAARAPRRGTVGTSVLWAIAERFAGVEGGLSVLGGTRVNELPNLITSHGAMRDIRVEGIGPKNQSISWGAPFPLPEKSCPHCGAPVPVGYLKCGVCGKAPTAP